MVENAEYVPDGWILLEPGRVFLWPLQGRRTWRWSLRSRVGFTIADGKARGYYEALEDARHAVKHAAAELARLPRPMRPDPGIPYEAEAYEIHLIPVQFDGTESG